MNMFGHSLISHLGGSKKIASYEIKLKDKKLIAEGTYEFVFEKPQDFHFQAGQHVRITLINPPETDSKGNSRFLTLASTPPDKDLAVAVRITDSAFKQSLGRMDIGEKVQMQFRLDKVHGSFTLHEDASKPAVFLIGGIGIVPAFSMIKDATERKLAHRIFLFYSNRRPEDAPYLDELLLLAKQNPNFTLIPIMTQPEKSSHKWQEQTGFINQDLLKKYIADIHSPIYYIAGLSGMVNSMSKLLKDMGISKENIREENFSDFKMHLMTMSPARLKSHFVILAFLLIIAIAIFAHVGIAVSIFNTSLLQNLIYLAIGSIFVIVILKIFVIIKLKHYLGNK
jgi:ferredoxin-NADP reductase